MVLSVYFWHSWFFTKHFFFFVKGRVDVKAIPFFASHHFSISGSRFDISLFLLPWYGFQSIQTPFVNRSYLNEKTQNVLTSVFLPYTTLVNCNAMNAKKLLKLVAPPKKKSFFLITERQSRANRISFHSLKNSMKWNKGTEFFLCQFAVVTIFTLFLWTNRTARLPVKKDGKAMDSACV